jgi:hypothetical protein
MMLSIEKIKQEFEFLPKSDSYDDHTYCGIWKFERLDRSTELFFVTKDGNISTNQIDNFNYLVQKIQDIVLQTENYISEDLKRKKIKNHETFLKGKLQIDIITVFQENGESDIEIICSKNYKKLLWNKSIEYVISINNHNVSEIIKLGE